MKKQFSILFLFLLCTGLSLAQNKKTVKTSFWVSGNCEMCKANIENALDQKGIRSAIWNEKTKMVSVVYDSSKVNVETMQKWIAAKGYETETHGASDSAYMALPACCKYERKIIPVKK